MPEATTSITDAVRHLRAGDVRAAAAIAGVVLRRAPQNSDALGIMGLVETLQQNHASAEAWFTRAIAAAPDLPLLYLHRGTAARALGHEDRAIADFHRAVQLDAGLAEAHHQLGNALKKLGRLEEATAALEAASRLAPENATVWLNLGVARLDSGCLDDAIEAFRHAISLAADLAEAHNVLGAALADAGRITEAQASFRRAIELRPAYAAAHNNLARALKSQARLSEAIHEYRVALEAAPDPGSHSNLVYALNFDDACTPETVFAEHVAWAQQHAKRLRSRRLYPNARDPERRLRVGCVSPDLVNHAVAFFFEPWLAARDRAALEVFCYSDAPAPDRVTRRLRSLSDHWHDTARLRDEEVDALIRRDQVDILIDLAGHTARNRLLVFARKPAPVQVTWLGYPNTTGLPAIDYRLTDAIADPADDTDKWHTERLARLARCFVCYAPPAESPPAALPERVSNREVAFGSFSNYAKLSDSCVIAWAEVLNCIPRATLNLKSRGLGDAETARCARARFERFGISGERILLDGKLTGTAKHLRQYHSVDIALDPFPYNGTTTTCEALWMGVPVVTLAGRTHVQRVGATLLTSIGRTEWIAESHRDYVARCIGLAEDVDQLRAGRAELRDQVRRSPLCNAQDFAMHLQGEFRTMWRHFCATAA